MTGGAHASGAAAARRSMSSISPWIVAAVPLGLLAIVLRPARIAELLVGDMPASVVADVVLGGWILKGTLLALSLALVGMAAVRLPWSAREPLVMWRVEEPGRATNRELSVLVGLLIVATAVRLIALGDGLWFDEIQTLVESVRVPFGHLVATMQNTNQHTLYSLLARGSVALFGESSWALRLPAAVLGIASLGALYWFALLVSTRREALLATALLALSYHHVWFSQNVRGYTALLLFTILGSGLFLRMLSARELPSFRLVIAYGTVMALSIYTHLTAAVVVAAHGLIWLALLVQRRRDSVWPTAWAPLVAFIAAGLLSLLLFALALPQLVSAVLRPVMPGVDTAWKSSMWMLSEALRVLTHGNPLALVVLAAAAIVGLAGAMSFARRHWAIAAVMLLPALLTAAAIIVMHHNFWPRFFFFSAGFAVLIAIRGAFALAEALRLPRARPLATAGVLAVIAASAVTVPRAWGPKQDFGGALRYVTANRAPGDAVVTVDMTATAYRWLDALPGDSIMSAGELEAIEARHQRTWLLYNFPIRLAGVHPDIWQHVQRQYREAASFPGTLGGGTIFVMVKQ